MKIVAMVPIKLKNERLPGKNTMILGGKPLIAHMLETLSKIKKIDKTYVFCSDLKINEYIDTDAVFLERSKTLDLQTATFNDIFDSFRSKIRADIYVVAHATSPFVKESTIDACINAVLNCGHDSAFTAIAMREFFWRNGQPMNFDPKNIPRTQDLEPLYCETSGAYVFKSEVYENSRRRIGENPFIAEVSVREAVDIDYKEDFEFAKYMLDR